MAVLQRSTCAEEGALRMLETALESWGSKENSLSADNVSIIVVNFAWQADGSESSTTANIPGEMSYEDLMDSTAGSVIAPRKSASSTRESQMDASGVGRPSCITFSASDDITSAVCTSERSNALPGGAAKWRSLPTGAVPPGALQRGRVRRNLTLNSGLSCTVDVSGSMAQQLAREECGEAARSVSGTLGGEIRLQGAASGHSEKREQLLSLRERLQPDLVVTVETG